MGRLYKTVRPEFIDFIFQPNLDMKMNLLNNEATNKYLKSKLLEGVDDVSFEHLDYDKDFANKKKDYYNEKADEIAQLAFETGEPKDYISKMKELQRGLEQDYNSGDIFKIQENLKAEKEFQENLGKLKNPVDREAYTNMWEEYKLNNQENRDSDKFGDVFSPGEMFESINYSEFLKSKDFKTLVPEEGGEVKVGQNGKWLVKKGNSWIELSKDKISSAFKNWLDNNPNSKGRFNNAKYFGESTEDYFDEQGNLKFNDNSILQKEMDRIGEIYSYRNEKSTEDKSANPFSLASHKAWLTNHYSKDKYARSGVKKVTGNIGVKANNLIDISEDLKNKKNNFLSLLKNNLKVDVSLSEVETFLDQNKETYPDLYNRLNLYNEYLNQNFTASRDLLSQALGSESKANNLFKEVDAEGLNTNWYFDFDYKDPLNKVDSTSYAYPRDFIGKTIESIKGIKLKENQLGTKIVDVEIKPLVSKYVPVDANDSTKGMIRTYLTLTDSEGNEHDIIGYKDVSYFLNSN